jgi:putative hydrolase of the HAD superfamily
MIRAVVFDLWNTLVYSPGGNPFQRLRGLLREDQEPGYGDLVRDGMTRPYDSGEAFLAAWQERMGWDDAQKKAVLQAFSEAGDQAACFPEAPEVVGAVRSLARVGLLSNTQSFGLELLDRLGIAERIRSRMLSAELGALKPELAVFEAVQRRLGLFPGNLIMVGDSWKDDVLGPVAAGWAAVWVNRDGQTRPEHDPEDPIYEVRSLNHVPRLIEDLQKGMRCPTCLG